MATEASFLSISRQLYKLAEVERETLFLQDRYGLNVNILLFCLWHGKAAHDALSPAFFEQVMAALEQWHETVVLPIRRVRRQLKILNTTWITPDERESLRGRVLVAEIAVEEGEQKIIWRVFAQDGKATTSALERRALCRKSLVAYAQARRLDDEPEVLATFDKLLAAAFNVS